ncbi:hypothetical protein ABVK25_008767 [Lepraria finkii]|uniref:Tyr recombinase domain-containing protein n=1 Tax=Lepraria finkii TaxID=1340010 RepID=A0ABR4B1Z1_9LECA
MGVAQARDAARAMRQRVKYEAADPIAEARRKRAVTSDAREGIGTLLAAIEAYGQQRAGQLAKWHERHGRMKAVFAPHLDRPLRLLRRSDLQTTIDDYKATQSARAAANYLRPILKWAIARDMCPADLSKIVAPGAGRARTRTLSQNELAALLPVLTASDRPYPMAMRFMLLTLARREEVCAACWRDIDLAGATWRIPTTKNGLPHVVPLSTQALDLLRQIGGGKPDRLVFTTLPPAKMAAEAGLISSGPGRLTNWDREGKSIMEASGTAGWTRHDLRRTGATMLGEMGELPDIIEAALNHVAIRSTLAATYNRARYRPQVATALQRLADALDEITSGGAEIVRLRPAG